MTNIFFNNHSCLVPLGLPPEIFASKNFSLVVQWNFLKLFFFLEGVNGKSKNYPLIANQRVIIFIATV